MYGKPSHIFKLTIFIAILFNSEIKGNQFFFSMLFIWKIELVKQ